MLDASTAPLSPGFPEPGTGPGRRPRHRRPRGRRMLAVLIVIAVLLVPVGVSYGRALTASGTATLSVRSVEWLRDHGLGPIVDQVEYWYYAHNQPTGTAPDPASLPSVARTAGSPPVGTRPAPLPVAGAPLPGEAAWSPTGQRVAGSSPLYTAWFRPDPATPSVVAGVAWMNQSLINTRLVAGTRDPVPTDVASPADTADTAGGQVPASLRPGLLATFNSGFKLRDARGGYYSNGHASQPLVDGAASLTVDNAGRVDIGRWGQDMTLASTTVAVRQNLAMIVEGGAPVPGLDKNTTGAWGSAHNQLQYTWRSGLGLDANGNLVYVAADQLSLDGLARTLAAAGAVRGMQLDIHPQTVGFLTYRPGQATSAGAGTRLLPSMRVPADRYLHPDQRDFLAVSSRGSARP